MTTSNDLFPIERYALLTENASELSGRLHHWFDFYKPATPAESELLSFSVMASVLNRRTHACLAETANHEIRSAKFLYDCDQEDQVRGFLDLLETQPSKAVAGLRRSALGCRVLIARYERLKQLMHENGTLYGSDRNELIRCLGGKANLDDLIESEGSYLTWLYCLTLHPGVDSGCRAADFADLHEDRSMPKGLKDRETMDWLGTRALCRQILLDTIDRELAELRPREEKLRLNHEVPGRAGAEVRKQVLAGRLGRDLVSQSRTYETNFNRALQAFLKGRKESAKTGRPPGAPESYCEVSPAETPRPDPADVARAEAEAAHAAKVRDEAAAGLAANPERDFGERFLPNYEVFRRVKEEQKAHENDPDTDEEGGA